MKRVSLLTMAAALALGTASMPALAFQPSDVVAEFDAGELGDEVRALVAAAQEAIGVEEGQVDVAAIRGQLEQAAGLVQNDDERFIVGQMLIQLAAKIQEQGGTDAQAVQVRGIRMALESDRVPLDRRGLFWSAVGNAATAGGDSAGALEAFRNALHYDPGNADALIQVALGQFNAGDSAGGYESARQAFAALNQAGREIPPSWHSVPFRAAYEANDVAHAVEFGVAFLRSHPTTTNWNEVLRVFQTVGRFDDQANLDVLRLMRGAQALDENSINEYVRLAMQQGLPGEAKAIYDAAVAGNAIPPNQEIAAEIEGDVPGDRADLPESAANARAAATGRVALNTGDAFASYGQVDQALEMYQLALDKGGVDAGTVHLRRGTVLNAAGRTAEARAEFEAVSGARAGHAAFWMAWLDQHSGGSSASAEEPAE